MIKNSFITTTKYTQRLCVFIALTADDITLLPIFYDFLIQLCGFILFVWLNAGINALIATINSAIHRQTQMLAYTHTILGLFSVPYFRTFYDYSREIETCEYNQSVRWFSEMIIHTVKSIFIYNFFFLFVDFWVSNNQVRHALFYHHFIRTSHVLPNNFCFMIVSSSSSPSSSLSTDDISLFPNFLFFRQNFFVDPKRIDRLAANTLISTRRNLPERCKNTIWSPDWPSRAHSARHHSIVFHSINISVDHSRCRRHTCRFGSLHWYTAVCVFDSRFVRVFYATIAVNADCVPAEHTIAVAIVIDDFSQPRKRSLCLSVNT